MSPAARSLTRYALLSMAAAVMTIALKSYAYCITGSVGLLSDALESLINLLAALIALAALTIASRPPDETHAYGHEKIEYFSSGAEGMLILLAAMSIALAAWERLLHPQPLQKIDLGLMISGVAAFINFLVARVLLRVGKRYHSITLEADGKHLLTDVWTTAGVILGVGAIAAADWLGYRGWEIIDPVIALLVALNITWAGMGLMRRTIAGLMDSALCQEDQQCIQAILEEFERKEGISFHALRTRLAGTRRFMSVHILVPGDWTVQKGHDLSELIESRISSRLDNIDIDIHLEPIEDIASWQHNLK